MNAKINNWIHSSFAMFGLMPLLMFFFAVTMGINH
jgi:hypothetical protein